MGEMADYTNELFESEDLYFDDVMYIEEEDAYIGPGRYYKRDITCKFCGKPSLKWGSVAGHWILFESSNIHKCPKKSLPLEVLKELARLPNSKKNNE